MYEINKMDKMIDTFLADIFIRCNLHLTIHLHPPPSGWGRRGTGVAVEDEVGGLDELVAHGALVVGARLPVRWVH